MALRRHKEGEKKIPSREGTGSEAGRGVLERAMIIDLHQNQIKVS